MNWKHIAVKPLFILALLFFALYSLGQLQRIEVAPNRVFYFFDVVIAVFIGYWLLFAQGWQWLLGAGISWRVTRQTLPWVIATAWLLQGWIFNPLGLDGGMTAGLYLGRLVVYAAFTYLLAAVVDWRWWMKELEATIGRFPNLIMFTLSGLLIMYFGFMQYVLLPDTRFLAILGWDDHYYRMIGTMLDPAFMGIILVLTFIGIETIFTRKHRVLQTVFSLLVVLAISLTFSRSSYLALLIAGGVLCWARWWQKTERWRIPLLLVVFAACVIFIPKPTGEGVNLLRTSTVIARHESVITVVESQTPLQWLIGRGLFVPKQTIPKGQLVPDHAQQPDMFLLTITTGYGLVGWGIIGWLLYQYRGIWQRWPSWMWASVMAVLAASLFSNTLFQPFVWLWLTGILWSAHLESKRHN